MLPMLDIFRAKHSEEVLFLERWHLLMPQLTVGFTTKKGGFSKKEFAAFNLGLHVDDDQNDVRLNRQKLSAILEIPTENWICCEQTHGNEIAKVQRNDAGKGAWDYSTAVQRVDGLYTNESNILLALCYADCVPVYFAAPKQHLIGLAHAGWKGSVKNIAAEMIHIWKDKEGVHPDEIYAAIGPSIGKCCYIVDDQVVARVNELLGKEACNVYDEVSRGQYSLNLKELNRLSLLKAGVPRENIIVSQFCTSCEKDLFFSHRRDKGKTGRMMSFIGWKEEE